MTVDNEKAIKWLQNGALPTERVEKLLKISGAWDEFTAAKAREVSETDEPRSCAWPSSITWRGPWSTSPMR